MPAARAHFAVPPDRAFAILSQPRSYAFWVAGARDVDDHDANWPEAGATFRHTQGIPPFTISDTTSVVASDPPRRLELEARVRPLLVARVILELEPDGEGGTVVTMDELPVGGLLELPLKLPPVRLLVRLRNRESLRRLRQLADGG